MKKRALVLWILVVAAMTLLAGCGAAGGGGEGGSSTQPTSTTGHPSVAAKTGSLPSGSSQCPTGGVSIDTGIDQNGNGVLDSYEVTNTVYVCNGATGSTGQTGLAGQTGTSGLNALIKTTAESAGTNCANGGLRIDSGLDLNSNGALATTEVTSTS